MSFQPILLRPKYVIHMYPNFAKIKKFWSWQLLFRNFYTTFKKLFFAHFPNIQKGQKLVVVYSKPIFCDFWIIAVKKLTTSHFCHFLVNIAKIRQFRIWSINDNFKKKSKICNSSARLLYMWRARQFFW